MIVVTVSYFRMTACIFNKAEVGLTILVNIFKKLL
jgi:hypothetical protein